MHRSKSIDEYGHSHMCYLQKKNQPIRLKIDRDIQIFLCSVGCWTPYIITIEEEEFSRK